MNEHDRGPARVLICGGGVAALEALLALRELLAIRPHVELVAPNKHFVYQPMAVAEPFDLAETRLFDLESIAKDQSAQLHIGLVQGVDADAHQIELAGGERLGYDFAVIAVGARRETWLDGATSFAGADDVGEVRELLARLERGRSSRLALVAPTGTSWQLPMYELAMLTSSRLAERGAAEAELSIVTPEAEPLAMFGEGASRMLRSQLADRGIRLRTGAETTSFEAGHLRLSDGRVLEVDEVIALPRLRGPGIEGLPRDGEGFIPVDEHCRVEGMHDVFAAGDGTNGPFKQGGLATQQADAAAEAIAARLGDAIEPAPFEPLLRGMLLTGLAPIYMRSGAGGGSLEARGEVGANPLWWPPTKIAGRYLGPYLAFASSLEKHAPLEDRPVEPRDAGPVLDDPHREARELALVFAEADARGGDFRSALAWLDVLERLDGVLPTGYLDRRRAWRAKV